MLESRVTLWRTVTTRTLAFLFVGLVAPLASAQPPGYYTSVNTSNATVLRQTLHAVIDDHVRYPYTSSATDTWNILELADENPTNSSRILDVYKNASYAKVGAGNSNYDREHSWPKSYGFPNDNSSNYPYTDCHHLFLANGSYNSSRGNKPYAYCDATASEKTTLVNAGMGGGSGVYPGNSNWTTGSQSTGSWETWGHRRGDVARALLYLDVRYEGGTHGVTGAAEPDLILTDERALIASSNTGSNGSVGYMGLLSVLLEWHADDPVDAIESDRNDVVYSFQGNRNPFIDHPEWVAIVFGGGGGGGGGGSPWINEFHYDNAGSDVNEFVEVAGSAGTDLSGWTLVAYNGSGGSSYKTVSLSGTIPNQQNGYGTLDFTFTSLQNGDPDGIALVDDQGDLIEFLSYEGTFAATNGAAVGVTSTDVGVNETGSTSSSHSLQRGGTGNDPSDFTWQSPQSATRGAVNAGQTFQ